MRKKTYETPTTTCTLVVSENAIMMAVSNDKKAIGFDPTLSDEVLNSNSMSTDLFSNSWGE